MTVSPYQSVEWRQTIHLDICECDCHPHYEQVMVKHDVADKLGYSLFPQHYHCFYCANFASIAENRGRRVAMEVQRESVT